MLITITRATYISAGFRDSKGDILPNVLKKVRKAKSKNTRGRRNIKTIIPGDGFEYTYHATKGWRKNKI